MGWLGRPIRVRFRGQIRSYLGPLDVFRKYGGIISPFWGPVIFSVH